MHDGLEQGNTVQMSREGEMFAGFLLGLMIMCCSTGIRKCKDLRLDHLGCYTWGCPPSNRIYASKVPLRDWDQRCEPVEGSLSSCTARTGQDSSSWCMEGSKGGRPSTQPGETERAEKTSPWGWRQVRPGGPRGENAVMDFMGKGRILTVSPAPETKQNVAWRLLIGNEKLLIISKSTFSLSVTDTNQGWGWGEIQDDEMDRANVCSYGFQDTVLFKAGYFFFSFVSVLSHNFFPVILKLFLILS